MEPGSLELEEIFLDLSSFSKSIKLLKEAPTAQNIFVTTNLHLLGLRMFCVSSFRFRRKRVKCRRH